MGSDITLVLNYLSRRMFLNEANYMNYLEKNRETRFSTKDSRFGNDLRYRVRGDCTGLLLINLVWYSVNIPNSMLRLCNSLASTKVSMTSRVPEQQIVL